jgi:uncharacterized protein YutE (UPF0331/DUF86 family)
VDRDIIARKLERLRHHVARIDSKKPFGAGDLGANEDLRDVVVFNLVQAVEVCVDIGMHIVSESELAPPESMGEVFERLAALPAFPPGSADRDAMLRLKKAVGFRNVAVHAYATLALDAVEHACGEGLADLAQFAAVVGRKYLAAEENGMPGEGAPGDAEPAA